MSETEVLELSDDVISIAFIWAVILEVLGFMAAAGSYFLPVTASYSDTLNIGLLQQQMMAFHAGLMMILVGAIIHATHVVVDAIGRRV